MSVYLKKTVLVLAIAFAITFVASGAFAEDTKPAVPSIAVVDVQGLLNDSRAAMSIKKQAQDLRDKYQAEFDKLEKDLRAMEADFVKRREGLSEDDIKKERIAFEEKLREAQTQVRKRRSDLETAVGEATQTLRKKILEHVAKLSTQRDYDLVISRQDVVIVSKDFDITQDIMDLLNDDLKTVELAVK
jgi:Skp family chaperone for outer membrane proteins